MKNFSFLLFVLFILPKSTFSQEENYSLSSKNLHKKVRKTTTNYFAYDDDSGGFVLRSTNIDRYNNDGFLVETLYQYNGSYATTSPTKKLYTYNSKNMVTNISDISVTRTKYSINIQFSYNNDGNISKKESMYSDGSKFYSIYEYDKKENLIKIKDFSTENKLTSETNISYKGKVRKEERTSYNSKDASIYGTYTTIFKDDIKTEYISNSSYGNSKTTYLYNKENDLASSSYFNKTNTISTYDYEYDRKDNWIKKHHRNGKYQSFYFREIIFDNGDTSGNSNFDANFIKKYGNFINVAVVPLKMKENKKTDTETPPIIIGKTFNFENAYIDKTLYDLKGSLIMTTVNGSVTLKNGDQMFLKVTLKDKDYKYDFTLNSYKKHSDKDEWLFTNKNGNRVVYWKYDKEISLKDEKSGVTIKTKDMYSLFEVDQPNMTMYLK